MIIEVNQSLMPHSVAAATGCNRAEALTLLLMLYGSNVVNGFILIYHHPHIDVPVDRRPLKDGLPPKGPFECPICETVVVDENGLYFDFEFLLIEKVEFLLENGIQ